MLIGCNGDPPVLLRNNAARENHWVGLRLQGVACNRDGVGARLTWAAVEAAETAARGLLADDFSGLRSTPALDDWFR